MTGLIDPFNAGNGLPIAMVSNVPVFATAIVRAAVQACGGGK